tara:strand:+ start:1042 stop:2523 length:1482 start_codon:yes stop_codon:yes gene_type:complete
MINCDILITTVPYTATEKPLQAPAILKAMVEKHNFSAETYDLNHKFIKCGHQDLDLFKQYFSHGTIDNPDKIQNAEQYVQSVATELLEMYNPKFVAISVFTYQCQTFALLLAQKIRLIAPDIKIIFGGQGLTTNGIHADDSWPRECKELGYIDHYIIAEGEEALVNLLKCGHGPGIDNINWQQKSDIDDLPYPNYDGYKLDNYDGKKLMITGSRGCVRRCTFCDIHKHWKKFVFRSGRSIADEMIHQSKKYKINNFSFTDSLVNGSMKAYRDFITIMSDYNDSTENKLSWEGQFIVRGIKHMTEEDWLMTKKSGATSLYIGVESGSEKVRNHMKKQFSDKDMDEFMEQAYRNNVKCIFLMLLGYPTETHEDFLDNLRMFERYKKYQNVIESVNLGTTLGILPGTPLADDFKDDIQLNGGENFWIYKKNSSLDFRERIKRRMIIGEECKRMGYEITSNQENYRLLHYLWNIYKGKQKQDIIDLDTSDLHQQKYS